MDCNNLCRRLQKAIGKNLKPGDIDNKIITIHINDIVTSQETTKTLNVENKKE
mgnify:FL=1